MRTLTGEQLGKPAIALCYAIVLIADDDPGAAKAYVNIAMQREMLPEEKALLDRVTAAQQGGTLPSQQPPAPGK